MTAAAHGALMSLDDWRALGEDSSRRYELQEGVLIDMVRPRLLHQKMMARLTIALSAQTPDDVDVCTEPEVILVPTGPATVRVPDIVMLRGNDDPIEIGSIELVVEILSPGTRGTDRVMKRHEYAVAGIENYWIVDLDDATVEILALTDSGEYRGETVTGEFTVTKPFEMTVDLDTLIAGKP